MHRRIELIYASDKNGLIGRADGSLPWFNFAADMRKFREMTLGSIVVMGRRTWESIGLPLKHRVNVVVSRSSEPCELDPPVFRYTDLISALTSLANPAKFEFAEKIFIIGGAEIYNSMLNDHLDWLDAVHHTNLNVALPSMPGDAIVKFSPETSEYLRVVSSQCLEGPFVGLTRFRGAPAPTFTTYEVIR